MFVCACCASCCAYPARQDLTASIENDPLQPSVSQHRFAANLQLVSQTETFQINFAVTFEEDEHTQPMHSVFQL